MRIAFALAVLSIGALLRLYHIGFSSYWLDEMVSLNFSSRGGEMIFRDNAPFLYHLLLSGWIHLFGDSEAATRTLSTLFSVGTLALLGRWAWNSAPESKRWRALFIVMPLYAISHLSILYAQETRMYAMLEFGAALNMIGFLRVARERRLNALYLFSLLFMMLTHYLALIPIVVESALLFRYVNDRRLRQTLALAGTAAIGIAVLSYLEYFSWQHLGWQQLRFAVDPSSWLPHKVMWVFLNESFLFAAAFSFLVLWNWKNRPARDPASRLLPLLIAIPFLSLVAAGLITRRSIMDARYFIFLNPLWIAWITLLILNLETKKKAAAMAVFALISLDSLRTLPPLYSQMKAPWREMAKIVGEKPGSVVLTTRTVALRTPYFERLGIPVIKWEAADPDQAEKEIRALLKVGKDVWILDNYWGAVTYIDRLQERLGSAKDLKLSPVQTRTAHSEPIFALHIEKK